MRELLEMIKVFYHYSFLLPSDGPASRHRQNEQDTLAVFLLARVSAFLVLGEILLCNGILVTELTHQRAAEHWRVREAAQAVARDLRPRHVGTWAVSPFHGFPNACLIW